MIIMTECAFLSLSNNSVCFVNVQRFRNRANLTLPSFFCLYHSSLTFVLNAVLIMLSVMQTEHTQCCHGDSHRIHSVSFVIQKKGRFAFDDFERHDVLKSPGAPLKRIPSMSFKKKIAITGRSELPGSSNNCVISLCPGVMTPRGRTFDAKSRF